LIELSNNLNIDINSFLNTNNSNTIIKNNQVQANSNCSNISAPIYNTNTIFTPILYKSIMDKPLPHNSDLKKNFLFTGEICIFSPLM
jgi:hypothetical protein